MEEENNMEEEDKSESTYSVNITCDNCGDSRYYHIPYGLTVRDFLKGNECDKCGCEIKPTREKF